MEEPCFAGDSAGPQHTSADPREVAAGTQVQRGGCSAKALLLSPRLSGIPGKQNSVSIPGCLPATTVCETSVIRLDPVVGPGVETSRTGSVITTSSNRSVTLGWTETSLFPRAEQG